MNWFSNRCQRHRQSVSLLASGVLSEKERTEIEEHLADCSDCRAHYNEVKDVAGALADYRKTTANLEPTQSARQRWARAIHAANQTESAGETRQTPSSSHWWREVFWPCRHAWGAIAILWFVMWGVNWARPSIHNITAASPVTQTFEEERRLLAELLPAVHSEPAEPPRRKDSPHSEWQTREVIV